MGNLTGDRAAVERSLELAMAHADIDHTTRAGFANAAGLALLYSGDRAGARERLDKARAWATMSSSPFGLGWTSFGEGEFHRELDTDLALRHLQQAATSAAAAGSEFLEAAALTSIASILVRTRDHAGATDLLPTVIETWRRSSAWTPIWTTLRLTAELMADLDRPMTAALLLEAADRSRDAAPILQEDEPRMISLRDRIASVLTPSQQATVVATAATASRTDILARALHELAEAAHQHAPAAT